MGLTRETLSKDISDLLRQLAEEVKTRSSANLNDACHVLETVMARFFNALHGWDLNNLNLEKANFPAVDLGDRQRRVAVQVTVQDAGAKITHTQARAVKHELGKDFDRLILFFLLAEAPTTPKEFTQPEGGPHMEFWDLGHLLGLVTSDVTITPEALEKARDILRQELRSPAQLASLARRHTLPPPPTTFVGRVADLETLREMRAQSGTAVITGLRGMGGIGKTALALVLAHEWKDQYPAAQIWLDGRGTHANPPSAAALLAQAIQAFQPDRKPPEERRELETLYYSLLQHHPSLIVLDNASSAEQAGGLTPPPGSALIVTCRHNFMVGKTAALYVGKLSDAEATELLRELYPALNDADAAALVKLCCGLPLALKLAGSHLAMDAREQADVSDYITDQRSGRLATLDADAPDANEITISETLRLSEERLTEPERTAWRKLAVFASSFDARAAESIAGADKALLTRLERRSLLEREENQRFVLHDLAIDYALERLGEGKTRALRLARARHYIMIGYESQALYLKGKQVESLALFDRERTQIESAFVWLNATGTEETARLMTELVNVVAYTSHLRFHPRERILWLEAQLAAARQVGLRHSEGTALGNLGNAHFTLGNPRKAIEFYEKDLFIARETGDLRAQGVALGNLGNAYKSLGEIGKAIEYCTKRLIIARKVGDRRGESVALGTLGSAFAMLGNNHKAIEIFEHQLAASREIGNRQGEGDALGNLGIAYKNSGAAHKSIEFLQQWLVIAREIGDQSGEGDALGNLGNAYGDLGDARKAIDFFEQSLVLARETGDRRGEGITLWNIAWTHESLGERDQAITCAEAALPLYEATEHPSTPKIRAILASWRGLVG